jgi:CHAD domain-containing protein
MSTSIEYTVPVSMALSKVKKILVEKLKLTERAGERSNFICLDTFDWRLYSQKYCLEICELGGCTTVRCRRLCSRNYRYRITVNKDCRFYWDLPASVFRERLQKWIKVRALIPQLELRVRRDELVKLNRDDKTVLRILLEDYQVRSTDSGTYKKLQKRLQIIPVKGYPNPQHQVVRFIENEWRLGKPEKDILVTGLNALGRQPADYSAKSHVVLRGEMHTDKAVKTLLSEMLDVMQTNEDGIRDDIDTEFLHDYRVATRKTRSMLRQVKHVFTQRAINKFNKQFSWLGTLTGPARDMDVYLLKFDDYRRMLPADLQEHLDPLHRLLEKKRQTAYKKLVRTFDTKHYRDFMDGYREFLQGPAPRSTTAVNAQRPVKLVADERIWKVYKKAMKEGSAINEASPAEELHELRKTFKKLRYLIEFFQSLYDSKAVKRLVNAMKAIQDNLGNLNDFHVQAEALKSFGEEMGSQRPITAQTRQAMDYLVQHLEDLQHRERSDFAEQFKTFSNKTVSAEFQRLFKGVGSASGKQQQCI